MSIKVMTDGSLDVPTELLKQYDIPVVAPIVTVDGKEYRSGIDITIKEFFAAQRTAATLPTTSQPSPGQFVDAFEAALREHDQILYVAISSALSGTMNSAQQAASEFPEGKIVLHDSCSVSAEGGLQVVAAARAVAQGSTMEEAVAAVRRTQSESQLFFALDDLTYLVKGGRVGRVAGAIGSLLNMKPIITVNKQEGTLAPLTRIRTFKAAVKKLLDLATDVVGPGQPGRFVILYGEMEQEANEFAGQLRQQFDARWLHLTPIAPTLGAHTGPRALGVVVAPGDWPS
jgi:DegV family protein with EDD domain